MLIAYEREKLANAIKFFVQNTRNCGITKLFKLLYFLDFLHFREAARSVTGLKYIVWPKGPAPRELWHEIKSGLKDDLANAIAVIDPDPSEDRHLTKITVRTEFDGRHFSKREMRLLVQLAEIYRDARASDMVEVTHLRGAPWDVTKKQSGPDSEISYMLALDGRGADQLDIEEAADRVAEREETRKLFS